MKKTILFVLAIACLLFATACEMSSGGDDDDPAAGGTTGGGGTGGGGTGGGDVTAITATTFSVTLDTTSGSAIPDTFNATCNWEIKDSDWVAGDVYTVQAYFTGTGVALVEVGTPYTLESKQKGTGSYTFKITDTGLPASVKRPYELKFIMKKGDTPVLTSNTYSFTEGPLTGVHTGCLYYYTDFNEAGEPIDADGYDFKATLVQYGKIVLASNILYLEDTNDDGVFESETPQTCTVIMEASVVDGKTKLTGTGSFTGSDGETESYSGEAFVFGDGRSISCDSYWEADDTTKKSCGTFDCTKMGTSSIKGTVTISGTDGRSDLKFIEGEGTCVAAVLFGFDGDDMEDNAGAMTMGKVAVDGGIYTFAYEIKDIPAGEYYIFFGGLDQGDDVAEGDRLPDKTGEAVGVCGTTSIDDVAVLTDWIDGSPSDATKAAIAALKPIEVKEGETVLNLDFTAYVRSTDAPTP